MDTKLDKKRRHQKTSQDFEEWLKLNPDASIKRQIGAFNSIADSNYREAKTKTKVKKAEPKKLVKRI